MPYAVISDRGCQYTVKAGERVRMATHDAKPGDKIVFDHVLLLGGDSAVTAGAPEVAGARVEGTVLAHGRGKKLIVYKIRRRKGYRRKQGHRQNYTDVRIDSVMGA